MQLARDDFVASGSDGFRALRIEHSRVRSSRLPQLFFTKASARTKVLKWLNGMAGERGNFPCRCRVCTPYVRGVGQLAFAEEVVLPAPSRDDWVPGRR